MKDIDRKVNYWICIVNPYNMEKVIKELSFGVEEYHHNKYERVNVGDIVVFYFTKIKKFGYILKVIKKEVNNQIFGGFPLIMRLELIKKTELKIINKKLIIKLSLFKNKNKWGGSFQGKPLINIDERDFKIIKDFLC
jgi:predicted RNA-binding protein